MNDPLKYTNWLRSLFGDQTNYDIDTAFTPKQREIIVKALQALADHPKYGPAMAALADKKVDINIVADPTGVHTRGNEGATIGRNDDGTVDEGDSITIYIHVNPHSSPITDFGLAIVAVHELIHSLGVPAFDVELDNPPGNDFDKQVTKDLFSGYDFAAVASPAVDAVRVIDAPATGGTLAGLSSYEVFSGSDADDLIAPGGGGSLIYSGDGNDQIILTLDGEVDEIIDSAGVDVIELSADTILSAVYTRLSADGQNLALMVNGQQEAVIFDAASNGAVEQLTIGTSTYSFVSLPTINNVAPDTGAIGATVYDSFFGGWIASGAVADPNGDTLSYRLGSVTGEGAGETWSVDEATGAISANFVRFAQSGSEYTFVTLIASDGLDLGSKLNQ